MYEQIDFNNKTFIFENQNDFIKFFNENINTEFTQIFDHFFKLKNTYQKEDDIFDLQDEISTLEDDIEKMKEDFTKILNIIAKATSNTKAYKNAFENENILDKIKEISFPYNISLFKGER